MNQATKPSSPLTGSNDVVWLRTEKSAAVKEKWRDNLHIDITAELGDADEFHLYRCSRTGLLFFTPETIAGSEELYRSLENFEWYYQEEKWEHDVGLEDIKGATSILEVGCGRGAFLGRVRERLGIAVEGTEFSASAVNVAQERGLPVSGTSLKDLAKSKIRHYDAVCAFQVLEHVPEPGEFLKGMIKLLRKGGKLIIAVPNGDSFLKYANHDLLNQPPHHMTLWSRRTFESFPDLLPVKVIRIIDEPLHPDHFHWFIDAQLSRLPRLGVIRALLYHSIMRFLLPVLKRYPKIGRLAKGHSIYASFEKC